MIDIKADILEQTLRSSGRHTYDKYRYMQTHLSGPVAEGLSHGDVTHTLRTGGLTIIQCLCSLGSPGKKRKITSTKI